MEGRWSRLLIDLNRSETHPRLVPRRAFGLDVPGNAAVPPQEREERLERYWRPHRRTVTDAISTIVARHDACLHVAVHSFVPVLAGRRRDCDVGLLFDPKRSTERVFATRLRVLLRAHGFKVRFNYPYRGNSDGLTTALRCLLPAARYAGIEIELNQDVCEGRDTRRAVGKLLASILAVVLSEVADLHSAARRRPTK